MQFSNLFFLTALVASAFQPVIAGSRTLKARHLGVRDGPARLRRPCTSTSGTALAGLPTPSSSPSSSSAVFPPVAISDAPTPDVPSGGTVAVPTTALNYLAIGVGTQNYTCVNGSFSNTGALATMHDISQDKASATTLVQQALTDASSVNQLPVLGQHFFTQSTFGASPLPKFDFTSTLGSSDAFALGQKVGDVPSPSGAANAVAWLQLKVVEGKLGSTVLRTDTQAGVLKGSCGDGETSTANYAALYWFYD